jgi:LysM repeat protein
VRAKLIGMVLAVSLAYTLDAAAAPPPWQGRYSVRSGDSLSAIASRYGTTFLALAKVNGLDWRGPLQIGVVLRVPTVTPRAGGWVGTYLVRAGDTLSGIALRYKVSLARLVSVNGIDPANLLLVGTRLRVPTATLAVDRPSPFAAGAVGYDVSYPNCAAADRPPLGFAIVGLNHGRPFTTNPCFARQWAAARQPASVYINTAFSDSLVDRVTPDCAAAAQTQRQLQPGAQHAYAVGCAEAEAALQLLGATMPLTIWLDVEPDNTWAMQPSLNAAAIRGTLDHLLGAPSHPLVGIYSNASFWRQIVGSWSLPSVPEWVATAAPDPPDCPTSFAGGAVWLAQSTNHELDLDTAC